MPSSPLSYRVRGYSVEVSPARDGICWELFNTRGELVARGSASSFCAARVDIDYMIDFYSFIESGEYEP